MLDKILRPNGILIVPSLEQCKAVDNRYRLIAESETTVYVNPGYMDNSIASVFVKKDIMAGVANENEDQYAKMLLQDCDFSQALKIMKAGGVVKFDFVGSNYVKFVDDYIYICVPIKCKTNKWHGFHSSDIHIKTLLNTKFNYIPWIDGATHLDEDLKQFCEELLK